MNEKQFEDIICRYPELIEDGLSLIDRQVSVGGKFVDVLFKDRHGQKLIAELKKGPIMRQHIAQLLDYEGYFLNLDEPTVRVMLIGNRVPKNLRKALDHHGFEYKELTVSALVEFLRNQDDTEFLRIVEAESRPQPKSKASSGYAGGSRKKKGIPPLHTVSTFGELKETISIRAEEIVTNYMDLLLMENVDKSLSKLLKEFREYADQRGYGAFQNISYLRQHLKYREERGWIFEYSGDPGDPVVQLVGYKKE